MRGGCRITKAVGDHNFATRLRILGGAVKGAAVRSGARVGFSGLREEGERLRLQRLPTGLDSWGSGRVSEGRGQLRHTHRQVIDEKTET